MVVTRFAPSPTGMLHLGNVRTALLNWLFARRQGGRFLLRFEDTDSGRSQDSFVQSIQDDLSWLGLAWDGNVVFQSARRDRYVLALEELAGQGLAYRCFCSESRLTLDRKLAASRSLPPRYAGRCRSLKADVSRVRSRSEAFVWRLAASRPDGEIRVRDMLREAVRFRRSDLDDPIIVRSDGNFTFLLPNAMDDAADGITHVLRGDDHLTNSAYQVFLLEALGFEAPVYAHHSLLLGADGAKLSKRTGGFSVQKLREEGLLPMALVQAMSRLGHPNMPEDADTPDELARHFEPAHLSAAAVKWSNAELWRWHARLLHHMPAEKLAALLAPVFPEADRNSLTRFGALVRVNLERIEDARGYSRLLDADADIGEAAEDVIRRAGADFFVCALRAWQALDQPDWKTWANAIKEQTGRKGKDLFLPLRAALTGAVRGPEMSGVVAFLGADGVALRLSRIIGRVS